MEIIRDIEQGSEQWHELRLGKVTASRFKDVMAKGKGLIRKSYMYQLAAEYITGEKEESYSNKYMEWGTENEAAARAMYELETDCTVEQVAFIKRNENVGASPDSLVGTDGLLEIKCPKTTTQIETFLSGKVPSQHKPQIQGQLWVSEREWCDFLSFDPRINAKSGYFCTRVYRNDKYIEELEQTISVFIEELKVMTDTLYGFKDLAI